MKDPLTENVENRAKGGEIMIELNGRVTLHNCAKSHREREEGSRAAPAVVAPSSEGRAPSSDGREAGKAVVVRA